MDFVNIIEKKREGKKLSDEEIKYFIKEYSKDGVPDYQVSALLMAILFQGLDDEELSVMTQEMIKTGEVVDFSEYEGVFVDKHSTGGVGDKTSLVVGPIFSACGLKFAKMSGRGLGFTGGTVDKLESIPGYKVEIDYEQFMEQVRKDGIALIGQLQNMVYADKKLYALRDVTGTVPSIPLIASSIMSKKIAAGAQVILLDVKYGDGAFMKTKEDAIELAKRMIAIGEIAGKTMHAEITSMQDVLGKTVGNSLEVKEAIECLKGNFEPDFEELCLHSTQTILKAAKIVQTNKEASKMFYDVIRSGKALEEFRRLIKAQGGDPRVIDDPDIMEISPYKTDVLSEKSGFLNKTQTEGVGILSVHLGAGRLELGQSIDHSVGIEVHKKTGQSVEKGDKICTLYHKKDAPIDTLVQQAKELFIIGEKRVEPETLIYKTL